MSIHEWQKENERLIAEIERQAERIAKLEGVIERVDALDLIHPQLIDLREALKEAT